MKLIFQEAADKVTGRRIVRAMDAERNNAFVGEFGYGPNSTEEGEGGEISGFYVRRAYRGTNGGAAPLLQAAERRLAADGITEGHLYVMQRNYQARRFYERKGWVHRGPMESRPLVHRYLKNLAQG